MSSISRRLCLQAPLGLARSTVTAALIKAIGVLPPGKKRLIVAPDGILHTLPFEALASGPAQSFAELPYLLKSHAVSYIPLSRC